MRLALRMGLSSSANGAAFSPAALAPAIWFDPSDLTTLYTDAGVTNVSADGQAVYRMTNKGTLGGYVEQPTLGSRPLYKASGGLSWLLFDGSDDILKGALALGGSTLTAWAGVRNTSWSGRTRVFSLADAATVDYDSAARALALDTANGAAGYSAYRNGTDLSEGLIAANSDAVVQSQFDSANHTLRLNGADKTPAASTGVFSITQCAVGSSSNAGGAFAGRFYGGGILDRVLTAPEQASLDTYAASKAGLTL